MKNVGATHWTSRDAMRRAAAIAKLIHEGVQRLILAPSDQHSRMYRISQLAAAWRKDRDCTAPWVEEILLCGDLGFGASMAPSIDMLVLDNGFFSSVLGFEPRARWRPWEKLKVLGQGSENLQTLLVDYFGFNVDAAKFNNTTFNLHVLPVSTFADEVKRARYSVRHWEPEVLSLDRIFALQRYDPQSEKFDSASEEDIRFLFAPQFQTSFEFEPRPAPKRRQWLNVPVA